MHEADTHPVRDHLGGAHRDLREPVAIQCLALPLQPGEITGDAGVHQLLQQGRLATRGRQLKRTETQERRRDPAHDGARLGTRVAVIEHVAHHLLAGTDQRQRARGRHAQVVHRFAAQELADRRAQHCPSIGTARVRGRAGPLQLQLPVAAIGCHQLAQRDRTSVAELAGPMAELMATVIGGPWLHAGVQRVAAEYIGEAFALDLGSIEAEHRGNLRRPRQQRGRHHRGRHHRRPGRAQHFAPARAGFGVARQGVQQAVVETEAVGIHGAEDGGDGRPPQLPLSACRWPPWASARW